MLGWELHNAQREGSSMPTEQPIESKQLEEDDLRTVRDAAAEVEKNLRIMSAIAQRVLAREPKPGEEKSGFAHEFIIFAPGSSKQIHSNPPDGPCYTMIDPPGITRECTLEESTVCHAVDEVFKTLKE
jgi:hypothetical protein